MTVKEIMTSNPACCTPETDLQTVARMMAQHDCGEIPVVNNEDESRPVGVVTDRDIVCRALAQGKDPLQLTAADCMSKPCFTVRPDTNIEDCCKLLEERKIRRVPVVDEKQRCCGIISQADIAKHHLDQQLVRLVEEVSQPSI